MDFANGFGQWLAHFKAEDLAQIVCILYHQIEPLAQDGSALLARTLGPFLLGVISCINGCLDFVHAAIGDLGNHFACCRVENIECVVKVLPIRR